jgi:hypothetical protein
MTPSGIETATFQFVAQCLNQLRHGENVEYLNYLGSMITNDARCTREIKSRTAMAKAAFNKKKALFTSKLT